MIPRLFESDETVFDSFGICPLADAISCLVTWERNSTYVLDMEYPKDGRFVSEIKAERIILADPYDGAPEQEPFRISSIEWDMNGNMILHAEHISYQLNYIIVGKHSGYTRYPAKVWQNIQGDILTANPFSFDTDITDENGTVMHYYWDEPVPLRKVIGGMRGSMVDLYGGDIVWNRYTVKLLRSWGSNNGVKIAYSKNLTGLTYTIDMEGCYSGVVPYWADTENYVQGTVQSVAHSYAFDRVIPYDASEEFSTQPTVADLNARGLSYVTVNAKTPAISVDVEFFPLWQTKEYAHLAALEHVGPCDTVQTMYPPLDLDISAKVVRTVYDSLAERYTELTVSSAKQTLADTIFSLMKGNR